MKNLIDEELINQAAGFSCGCDKCLARVEPPRRELLSRLERGRKAIEAMEMAVCEKHPIHRAIKAESELAELRERLKEWLPVMEGHAEASHLLEGFNRKVNKWDIRLEAIKAACKKGE
jgi:hypothetical protein